MKTHSIAVAAVLAGLLITSSALGRGSATPDESLYIIPDMSLLFVGGAWETMDREMKSGTRPWDLETSSMYGFLGIDVTSWASIRGGLGQTERKDQAGDYGDSDTMWMAGLDCSLWRHDVSAPSYAAHTLELLVSYAYYDHTTGAANWTENRVAAVISAEFKAQHAIPSADNVPYSAVFSIGPVMSYIDGDDDKRGDFNERDGAGLLLGADLKLHRNLSLGWEGRVFSSSYSHSVVAAFHF